MPDEIPKTDTTAEVKRLLQQSEQALKLNYLIAIVVMAALGVLAIIAIVVFQPENSASMIGSTLSVIIPTTAALLAILKAGQNTEAVQDIHVRINSRMDQLLDATAAAERAKGLAQGKEEGTPQAVPGATPIVEVTKPTMVVPAETASVAVEAEKAESLKVELK